MCSQSRASLVQVMAVTLPAMTSLENSLSTVMGAFRGSCGSLSVGSLGFLKGPAPIAW